MKIKTNTLTGKTLDWAVANCEGQVDKGPYGEPVGIDGELHLYYLGTTLDATYTPSTNWALGGPIIEREKQGGWWSEEIQEKDGTVLCEAAWYCKDANGAHGQTGPTPLIAAMRCFVANKLSDEVEVPEELV